MEDKKGFEFQKIEKKNVCLFVSGCMSLSREKNVMKQGKNRIKEMEKKEKYIFADF